MRHQKKKKLIIMSLLGVLFLMSVSYAAFNTNLKIKGTSSITSNWDIRITNVTEGNVTGEAENAKAPTWNELTASVEANLYKKGDSVEYDITVENRGTFDAKLTSITDNIISENEAVKISFSGYTKGEKLYKNTSQIIKVKVEYNPEFEEEASEGSGEINIDLNYEQAEGGTIVPSEDYLLTYDYSTNGGTDSNAKQSYLTVEDDIELGYIAEKEGYEFVGWNTDKDAKEGLTAFQMPSQNTTLYAIYKRILTLNYDGIEKQDICTIYNNEKSCTVTLPSYDKDGYIFEGWYNEPEFINKIGNSGDNYEISNSQTIYSKLVEDYVNFNISTASTSSTITVTPNVESYSEITDYEYSIDGGETWVSDYDVYIFEKLTLNTEYFIKVRVTTASGNKFESDVISVTTKGLEMATFSEVDRTTYKTITITYPQGCGTDFYCGYKKNNDEVKYIGRSQTASIRFDEVGTLTAIVDDDTNYIYSTYNVDFSGTLKNFDPENNTEFHISTYREKIKSATILDNKDIPDDAVEHWDVSAEGNGSVLAWVVNDLEAEGYYKLYIGGSGGVKAGKLSLNSLFYNFMELTEIDLTHLDTSASTDMGWMFYGCTKLTALDLSNFDTSQVNHFWNTFSNCISLTELDISSFDTSLVTDMEGMFSNCSSLVNLDISHFITTKSNHILASMFEGCSSLTSLDFGQFIPNSAYLSNMFAGCTNLVTVSMQTLKTYNNTNGMDLSGMFKNCISLTDLDVSTWNLRYARYVSSMFEGCKSLTTLDVSAWYTSGMLDMANMFKNCIKLTSLDVSNWETLNVSDMSYMFGSTDESEPMALETLDVSNFDTSSVENMAGMFKNCGYIGVLNVSNWDTGNVTDMNSLFENCGSLTTLDVSNFNTTAVTNMARMFDDCSAIEELNVSNFDTSNVTDMSNMFYWLSVRSLDLSNWDTSKVTNMREMFSWNNYLTTLNITNFNTISVTDMNSMFYNCNKLTSLDLSNWNTSNVTDMSSMFRGCSALKNLVLSNWDTSKVTNMKEMFMSCRVLTTLDISSFNTSNVTDMSQMFMSAQKLATIYAGTGWVINSGTKKTNMFLSCATNHVTLKE